ncbi:ShlB/FhaC/HecB family hemolysin secretion/activation protein [Telluria mixta]|uniref:ShlB/FhaC/HecB family hemolysin secretion/activation protein n=1 Tax=Telluria mixta TaxID=34071 RepID=A0ABT2BYY3_9BURK|nr:ShlB/FhaC/HecB family hemolysin secretion/activation protein [Telluria mixta]MCS0630355.1 ShlB/FhaC/HecB family hemolysin secretion/activation protein [Telluria mixta]WEM94337.1 ShlB/FhaC/HecB family hemolysin secretion/activation protein [Telluria mixta]
MTHHLKLLPLAMLVAASLPALAQQTSLQENARQLPQPRTGTVPAVQPTPAAAPVQAGGQQVLLRRVVISGNTRIGSDALLAAIGPVEGKSFDFAGLAALAARVTAHYQQAGYPFARAYLPQQDLSSGELRIEVLEGRYGKVVAQGEPAFIGGAQGFLSALPHGDIIESGRLERVTLLLDDQPGVRTVPLVRPGEEVGTGDLLVDVKRDHRYKGEAGLDNYGTRATGRMRAHASVDVDSPFMLGDQIAAQALYTQEGMWFGSLAYSAPLGYGGLRGRASYTHSYYDLAGSFAALGARGTADVASVGLSYPIVRSQVRNLTLSASVDHKRLHDRQDATLTNTQKSSTVVPVTLSFDVRDQFLHAGITFGALSWTRGQLGMNGDTEAIDSASARSAGGFNRFNLDLARIQSLNDRLDVYARVSAQWTGHNLDSSEKLGLGGVNGVRAYPNGEGYGDMGWVAQTEVRYAVGAVVPYLFYDAGRVTLNKSPWTTLDNHRSLGGGGIGVRYARDAWAAGVTVAWRSHGGASQTDDATHSPAVLANVAYRF